MRFFKIILLAMGFVGLAFGGVISGVVTGTNLTDTAYVFVFHNYASLMDSGLFYTTAAPPSYGWIMDSSEIINDYDYNAMALIMTGAAPASGDPAGQYPGNPFRLSGGIASGINIPLATDGEIHGHITYSGSVSDVMVDILDAYWVIFGLPAMVEFTDPIISFDYSIAHIPAGPKTIRAFADLNHNAIFDSTAVSVEPFGWHENLNGGMVAVGGGCTTSVNITITTDVAERNAIPKLFGVRCVPNPFNSTATILIAGFGEPITVKIFDVSGRAIATILDNKIVSGLVATKFSAPEFLPSGKYFLIATSGERTVNKEITLIK